MMETLINIFSEPAVAVLLGILAVAAILITMRFQNYSLYQRQEQGTIAAWRSFAENNELTFKSGNFLNWNVEVRGVYRGYYLKLHTTQHQEDEEKVERPHYFTRYNNRSWSHVTINPHHYVCTNVLLVLPHGNIADNVTFVSDLGCEEQISPQKIVDTLIPTGLVCRMRKDVKITIDCQEVRYKQEGFEANKTYLPRLINMLCDIADNYSKVVKLGSEVIPILHRLASNDAHQLEFVASHLLQTIAKESLILDATGVPNFCPRCLVDFEMQLIDLPGKKNLTYYGCPNCHQNRERFRGQVIAVIDSRMEQRQTQTRDELKVNWLMYRRIFRFDKVDIGQATDEDVERFAVQVGNDTDKKRESHYRDMYCTIQSDHTLSENTMRILRHIFGNVIVEENVQIRQRAS